MRMTLVALAWAGSAQAAVHHVDPSGGGEFTTVSDAMAVAEDGDVILIEPNSTLSDCITVPASVGVDILGGNVTIDCQGGDTLSVFGTVRIAGVSLTSNRRLVSVSNGALYGADLTLSNLGSLDMFSAFDAVNSYVHIVNSTIANNAPGSGSAVRLDNTSARFVDVTFDANTATTAGGAVNAIGGWLDLVRVDFTNNIAAGNGGAVNGAGTYLNIYDSTFTSNFASQYGGAVAGDDQGNGIGSVTIDASTFTTNEAGGSGTVGGAVVAIGVPLSVADSTFTSNRADAGGAIGISAASADLIANTFSANRSVDGLDVGNGLAGGAAFLAADDSTVRSFDNVFDSNVPNTAKTGLGGQVFVIDSGWDSRGDRFDNSNASRGGHVYITTYQAVTMENTVFSNGEVSFRGGLVYQAGSGGLTTKGCRFSKGIAQAGGGAIAMAPGAVANHNQALFDLNDVQSADGGAIHAEDGGAGTSPADLFLVDSVLTNNSANLHGGAIYYGNTDPFDSFEGITLTRTEISDNTAGGDGGGIYMKRGELSVTDSWIVDNAAGGKGGGVYTLQAFQHIVNRALVCGNDSTGSGGGFFLDAPHGNRNFYNVALLENTSGPDGGAVYVNGTSNITGVPIPMSNDTRWVHATMGGNVSTGTLHDGYVTRSLSGGAGANPCSYPVFEDSIVAYQTSDYAMASVVGTNTAGMLDCDGNGFPDQQFDVRGTAFWQNTGVVPANGGFVDFSASMGNALVDPGLTGWTQDGDCWNDDLQTSLTGGFVYGSGIGASGDPSVFDGTSHSWMKDLDGDSYSVYEGDCDDGDANAVPGGTEVPGNGIDDDCVGGDEADVDGDGFGHSDCDDNDATIYPGATDTPYDGIDSNCDNRSDYDADGDGDQPPTEEGGDCDDTDPLIWGGAPDIFYDGVDRNCDGNDDDADGDGFAVSADCDDYNAAVNPDATEVWYDSVDDNCDGNTHDQDGDGYTNDVDCDDNPTDDLPAPEPQAASIYPGATEIWYDGVDSNCDGANDFDQDGDGYTVADGDCDDTVAVAYPGNPNEIPDGYDNDCTGGDNPPDTDGDGVYDYFELNEGTDPDSADSDGDGIDDGTEWGGGSAPVDTDEDGTPDVLDDDSDDDGLSDTDEAVNDSDGDGVPDYVDTDDDGDGVATADELDGGKPIDTDGDGISDHLDTDSDNDGTVDGADQNTGGPSNSEPDKPAPKGPGSYGCGCDASAGVGFGWMWMLGLVLLRRR